jgi:ferritin-like metal-binding protein YciE
MASSDKTIDDQLNKYLADALSIEEQALAQLRTAPDIAGDESLADAFRQHLGETEGHERLVRERLEARGGEPSRFKKLVMEVGGKGFILFARSQPDTPGKLTAHAYSYEALEQASYELLARVARRAGDTQTEQLAQTILTDEYNMADRLAERFDRAVDASLRDAHRDDLDALVQTYLADAHALESQSIGLLQQAVKLGGDETLTKLYDEHLAQTREQAHQVEARLEALGGSPSRIKDAAMRLGAFNWGGFFAAHPDTPGKLAAFAYAYEHLEIAGYELLERVANRANDAETSALARTLAAQERTAAARIKANFDRAAELALEEQGVR